MGVQGAPFITAGASKAEQLAKEQIKEQHFTRDVSVKVALPWATTTLQWTVVFTVQGGSPSIDFVFEDHQDFQPLCGSIEPQARSELAKLLQSWKEAFHQGPSELRRLLSSILRLLLHGFNGYQRARVSALGVERLRFELSCLPADEQDGTEVLLLSPPAQATKACFGIPVHVDVSGLRRAAAQHGADLHGVFKLHMRYPIQGNAEPERSLEEPAVLQGALPAISLPNWMKHTSMEYVPLVQERCQKAVDTLVTALPLQIQLIHGLSEVLGGPLECNFFQGSALWCITCGASTPLLLSIQANSNSYKQLASGSSSSSGLLPEKPPRLTIQAVRYPEACKTVDAYPWSPRWTPAMMASRILSFLRDQALPSFLGRPDPVLLPEARQLRL